MPIRNLLVAAAVVVASCVKDRALVPAPAANEVAGRGHGAAVATGGVSVEVRANAWAGFPEELTAVEALRVTLENGGPRPLRIRYADLALRTDAGERYAALPPFDVRGTELEVRDLELAPGAFRVAPYASRFYPGLEAWSGPFAYDPLYWDTHYTELVEIQLPTGDMVQKALPEGVLEPGGRITGFVYFRRLDPDLESVVFSMDLVDAATGETFGTASIPFRVVPRSEVPADEPVSLLWPDQAWSETPRSPSWRAQWAQQ